MNITIRVNKLYIQNNLCLLSIIGSSTFIVLLNECLNSNHKNELASLRFKFKHKAGLLSSSPIIKLKRM